MKYLALLLATSGLACAADFVTGQAARLVIGQENFTNQRPGATENILGAVSGVAYANDTLLVVDANRVQALPVNHRVLVYRNLSSKLPGAKAALEATRRCPVCGGSADVVLGQADFTTTSIGLTQSSLRSPTAVATDGRYLAVADTDNNRVLLWNNIPTSNATPADVVIGQANFTSNAVNFGGAGSTPSAKGLRGPQGVWLHGGKLYVADTQNHRVLVWNSIPTQNGQDADLVLGKPNFTTFVEVDLSKAVVEATASTLLNPVSVTTDGRKLYVADLGHNRVLIWNSIPTQNGQAADIALGQPDVTSTQERNATAANNSKLLCEPTDEKDDNGNDIYPARCGATMEFPRFALSDGTRLFVADGGNDRVLVYNSIPTDSGKAADVVLGQPNDTIIRDSSSTDDIRRSAADTMRTPLSLAWDGTNLYVGDPFNRRVLVFTASDQPLATTGVRNAASQEIFAVGTLQFTTEPKENDEITLKIGDKEYKYKALKDQDLTDVITGLTEEVNGGAGDPLVFASPNLGAAQITLTAKAPGEEGNLVSFTVTLSTGAQLSASALEGGRLRGGQDAAKIAPGSLVTILGQNLAGGEVRAPDAPQLPTELGGVQVYFDGIPAPLLFVSPTQINAQIPFEVSDAYSSSAYVRRQTTGGNVITTSAIAVPIVPENPGIFAQPGIDPRPAIAYHGSSYASALIGLDGGIKENDVATIVIEDREYSYTVKKDDTLMVVRDALVAALNNDEKVSASPAGTIFPRILIQARAQGAAGEGIAVSTKTSTNAQILVTSYNQALCCAFGEGRPITEANPARPGETITVYATGLGFVLPEEAKYAVITGGKYPGPKFNYTNRPIDAIAGGKTANVVFAGLAEGMVGVYEVRLQLNTDIPTNPQTQLTIAQDMYVSNIVTFPVAVPDPVLD